MSLKNNMYNKKISLQEDNSCNEIFVLYVDFIFNESEKTTMKGWWYFYRTEKEYNKVKERKNILEYRGGCLNDH